jgi:hypothetical protein
MNRSREKVGREEGRNQGDVGSGDHGADDGSRDLRVRLEILRVVDLHVTHAVLVIERDERNPLEVGEVGGHRLEVGDHAVRLEVVEQRPAQGLQFLVTLGQPLDVLGEGLDDRDLVVRAGDGKAFDLEDVEGVAEIAVPAVVARKPDVVPLFQEMRRHLPGTRRVSRSFPRDAVDYSGHAGLPSYRRTGSS